MSRLKIFGFDVFFVRASFSDLPILSGRIIIQGMKKKENPLVSVVIPHIQSGMDIERGCGFCAGPEF